MQLIAPSVLAQANSVTARIQIEPPTRAARAGLTLAFALLCIAPAHAGEPAPGELSERVVCRADPEYSYALALPSLYDAGRRWPVLYVLDARGRALRAAARFRAGAERYGWILVSSWDTASDGPTQPNLDAMQAMLRDTQQRLSVDTGRLYLAGFSGTARVAFILAESLGDHVAGIVAASGGLPAGEQRPPATPPPLFLTAGVADFNYQEMRELDEALSNRDNSRHRLEVFDGGHDWPPAELGEKAIAWLELTAMAQGRREAVPRLVSNLYEAWLAEASEAEERGDLYAAYLAYRSLARDVTGLLDSSRARDAAERLRHDPVVVSMQREVEQLASQEESYRRNIASVSRQLLIGDPPFHTRRLGSELELDRLRRLAEAEPSSLRGQSARRRQRLAYVQLSFYLPRELLGRGDYLRAAASLCLALDIDDTNPAIWYNLACAQAQSGQGRKALESLERALALGFANRELLESDPDLEPVRSSAGFRRLVAEPSSP